MSQCDPADSGIQSGVHLRPKGKKWLSELLWLYPNHDELVLLFIIGSATIACGQRGMSKASQIWSKCGECNLTFVACGHTLHYKAAFNNVLTFDFRICVLLFLHGTNGNVRIQSLGHSMCWWQFKK